MHQIEYFAFKIFKWFVKLAPTLIVKSVLDFFAFVAYKVDTKHRVIALKNLEVVFQNTLRDERKDQIIHNSYKNMMYGLYEFIVNQDLDLAGFEKKIYSTNEQYLLDAIASNKPVIVVSAHYGNWELLSSYIPLKYKAITVVGRPLNNDLLNDDLRKARNQHNCIMLDKKGAGKGLVKAIKDKRMIGLVIDQHASYDAGGIDIKFFGLDATQSDSSSRLAVKFDGIIIPVFMVQHAFDRYEVKFYPPIDTSSQHIATITQLQADVIATQILEYPDIWLWQHKRWKSDLCNIYK